MCAMMQKLRISAGSVRPGFGAEGGGDIPGHHPMRRDAPPRCRRPVPYCDAMPDLTDSIEVAASPEAAYSLLSDLPRMGSWSPECTGVTWWGRLRAPVQGARFIGHNRRGKVRWATFGEVVRAEPGRAFAFEVTLGPLRVARWEYLIEPTPTGCTVTEQWTDRRPGPVRLLLDATMGSRERANARGMRATLEAVKAEAERVAEPI
jgi:Polyketide cyclase / dehydrase and lipid transport